MTKKRFGFSKAEKLCSQRVISSLFDDGESFFSYPFNIVWMVSTNRLEFPARLAISVPRKSFKKAVHRNRIKRMIREAWRYNKHNLYSFLEQHNYQLVIMLIYNGKNIPEFRTLMEDMREMVSKFSLILPNSVNRTD